MSANTPSRNVPRRTILAALAAVLLAAAPGSTRGLSAAPQAREETRIEGEGEEGEKKEQRSGGAGEQREAGKEPARRDDGEDGQRVIRGRPLERPGPAPAPGREAEKPHDVRIEPDGDKRGAPLVALPLPGRYAAGELLELAAKLWGVPVRPETGVSATEIPINSAIGGQQVDRATFKLLMAAHRVYFFPHRDAEGEPHLVATRNPRWEPAPPRFTRIINVRSDDFASVAALVEREVEARNRKLPAGLEPIVAVASARTRQVFVRAPRAGDLEGLVALARKVDRPDPDRPRYFAYSGQYVLASELERQVRERLSAGELNQIRFRVTRTGNRLLFRAPPSVGDRVEELLKTMDRK